MTKIYADTDVCRWHLAQLNLEVTDEIVAGSHGMFHMPYPYDTNFEYKNDPKYSNIIKNEIQYKIYF
jgi:hypothetical protein